MTNFVITSTNVAVSQTHPTIFAQRRTKAEVTLAASGVYSPVKVGFSFDPKTRIAATLSFVRDVRATACASVSKAE